MSFLAIATFFAKMVLLITRYAARIKVTSCDKYPVEPNDTSGSGATPTTTSLNDEDSPLDTSYAFTVVVYALLNILRVVEYILLSYGLVKFTRKCSSETQIAERLHNIVSKKKRKKFLQVVQICIVMIPYFLLGIVAIPTVGIVQEILHMKRVACDKDSGNVFLAYCSVNVLRYGWDFSVRVGMIVTTLVVGKVWSTSTDLTCANAEPLENMSDRFAQGMYETDEYVKMLDKKYHEDGELAHTCNEIFQAWFILPWIIYFIAASLEVGNVLLPWQDDKQAFTSYFPKVYYLMYNINQLITLLVPYLCAKKMEARHKKYFKHMQDDISSKPFGATMTIQKVEHFDFSPRIIGTRIRVDISSPLYFLFLIVGFFFTICKTLL